MVPSNMDTPQFVNHDAQLKMLFIEAEKTHFFSVLIDHH